jgi:hypothetical protein
LKVVLNTITITHLILVVCTKEILDIYIYMYHVIWQVLTLGKREKCRNFWIPASIGESHPWSHFIPIYNILVCENTVIMVFVKNILLKWTYLTCMPLTLVTRVNKFYPLTFDRLFSIWFPFNNVTLKKIIWNLYTRPRIIKGRLSSILNILFCSGMMPCWFSQTNKIQISVQ